MSDALEQFRKAERDVEAARQRFGETAEEVQKAFSPEHLLGTLAQAMTDRAVGALLSRPVLTTLAISGGSFLIRNPGLIRSVARLFSRDRATSRPSRHSASNKGPQESDT